MHHCSPTLLLAEMLRAKFPQCDRTDPRVRGLGDEGDVRAAKEALLETVQQTPSWPSSLLSLCPHHHAQWNSKVGAFSCPSPLDPDVQTRYDQQRILSSFL